MQVAVIYNYAARLLQVRSGNANNELSKIVEWIPKVWQHLNKFLEAHSSSEVTVGPRLFLACPMDAAQAHVWFTDLYNFSIVPYLLEAVREGIQVSHVAGCCLVRFGLCCFANQSCQNIPVGDKCASIDRILLSSMVIPMTKERNNDRYIFADVTVSDIRAQSCVGGPI